MMKIKTIEVVDFNNIGDHIKWVFLNRVNKLDKKKYPGKVINLSFSFSRFLKPYHITPLACLVHEYLASGYIIKYKNIPFHIQEYLDSFHFFQLTSNPAYNDFPYPTDCKTLPLWLIDKNAISLYPGRVQKYYEDNFFSDRNLHLLSGSLSELLNNVFDHSNSRIPGYTFTQHNTTNNRIITSVCDFGVGIPRKIKEFKKSTENIILSETEALKEAIETKFSTKSTPHNKGRGWDNIVSNVKAIRAKLIVISNSVNYVIFPNGEVRMYDFSYNFHGTSVVITIDTRQISYKEPEEIDEVDIF